MTVETSIDELTANGSCSLREAIRNANSNAATHPDCPAGTTATDTIVIPAGFHVRLLIAGAGEDAGATGDLDLMGATAISGGGYLTTVVANAVDDRVFEARPGSTVRISGLRIEKGAVQDNYGGGILNVGGTLTIADSLVTANSVSTAGAGNFLGGGVANIRGSVTILGSSISGNTVTGTNAGGGGVGQLDHPTVIPTLRLENSTVSGNTAQFDGGGIRSFGRVTLVNAVVTNNKGALGGGISHIGTTTEATLSATNVALNENEAAQGGGAYINSQGSAALSRLTISRNRATSGNGGGLYLVQNGSASVTASDISVTENTAFADGGGLHVSGAGLGSVSLTRATVANNNAFHGDGVQSSLTGGGTLTLTNATISGNGTTGGGDGGGVNNASLARLVLANVTLHFNTAGLGYGGGSIYNAGVLTVRNIISSLPGNGGHCALVQPLTEGGRNLEHPLGGDQNCGFTLIDDPKLAALADNGGRTQTHALLAGSAALNRGLGCATTDQRGIPRSLAGACDIGAYEHVTCFGQAVDRVGTNGRDTLTGTAAGETFLTLGGNDTVNPGGGNDRLCLGAGNDTARIRGNGVDRANGQAGSRDRVIRSSNDIVTGFERFG